jgi:hypothetical protein
MNHVDFIVIPVTGLCEQCNTNQAVQHVRQFEVPAGLVILKADTRLCLSCITDIADYVQRIRDGLRIGTRGNQWEGVDLIGDHGE